MENKEKVEKVFFCQESVGLFNGNEKEALMKMANEGDLHAACVLVEGMYSKYRSWDEPFINEETGNRSNEKLEHITSRSIFLSLFWGFPPKVSQKRRFTIEKVVFLRTKNTKNSDDWFAKKYNAYVRNFPQNRL